MLVRRLTHSVKPFHLRKYSALPFTTRRRMILSTANSWTTAVSSVFLCLAVCFFLILPSMTSTRMAVHEHKHSATFRHLKLDTGATITRYLFLFLARVCAGTMAQEGLQDSDPVRSFQLLHLMFTHFFLFFQSTHTHANQCVYVHSSEEQHVTTTHEGNMMVGNRVHVRCRCLLRLRGRTHSRGAARLFGACRRELYVRAAPSMTFFCVFFCFFF